MVAGLPLFTESILGLPHLIVLGPAKHGVFILTIIVEYLFFLCLFLLIFECLNDLGLFLTTLLVFEVIHIKLMLQVINICVFFNVDMVVSL